MRRSIVLLLILAVLTAGCADFFPWSQSPSPSPTPDKAVDYPTGVNAKWIVAPSQLIEAHHTALNQSAYRLTARIQSNHSTGPKTWANSTLVAHHGAKRMQIQETGDILALRSISYPYTGYVSNRATIWREAHPSGDTYRYRVSQGKDQIQVNRQQVRDQIQRILLSGDYLANGTEKRNGTTLFRYNSTGSSSLDGIQSLHATVLLDQQGMIHELHGSLQTSSGQPTQVTFSFSFTRVAQPPSPPKWTDRVPHLRVKTTDAGALQITHTGGRPVPAGTEVSFAASNNSSFITGTANLSGRLSAGDSASLTIANLTGGSQHLQAKGTFTVNQSPQVNTTTVRMVPESGYITIETQQWSVFVKDQSSERSS